jgi:hypothetical protein
MYLCVVLRSQKRLPFFKKNKALIYEGTVVDKPLSTRAQPTIVDLRRWAGWMTGVANL